MNEWICTTVRPVRSHAVDRDTFPLLHTFASHCYGHENINPLTPNNAYSGHNSTLTSKIFILYIYSTNTGTEYFKHGIYSPFFFLFKMQFLS